MTGDESQDRGNPVDRSRDADRRFVDALLQHHFHGDAAASADRIATVLQQIEKETATAARARRTTSWFRLLSPMAAAILIATLMLVPTLRSNTASAAIDRAVIAMSRLVDLHYRIEIDTPVGLTLSGEIWFRGADLVTLRLDTVAGALWAGEGRNVAWVVPPLSSMPVRVNDKGNLLETLKVQDDVATPFLRLSTMLERLGESFHFEFGQDGETVEAWRVDAAPEGLPEHVQVRLASDGVVRRFEARWAGFLGPRACRLTWFDGDEVSASFYEHAAHHDAGRDVVDRR